MINAIRQFLSARLLEVVDSAGDAVFSTEKIFFEPLPRDFLKKNKYAACCLVLQDEKKKDGRMMANIRNEACTEYTRIRMAFARRVVYRVIFYAADFNDQWGDVTFKGFIDQFEDRVARYQVIADDVDMAVGIELYDAIRPWDAEQVAQMLKRRPQKAISRVLFSGGIYTRQTVPIIQDVDIQPKYL